MKTNELYVDAIEALAEIAKILCDAQDAPEYAELTDGEVLNRIYDVMGRLSKQVESSTI